MEIMSILTAFCLLSTYLCYAGFTGPQNTMDSNDLGNLPSEYLQLVTDYYGAVNSGVDLDANRDPGRAYTGLFFEFLGEVRYDVPISLGYDYTKDPLRDYGFTTIDIDDDGTMELIITNCEKERVFSYSGMDSVDGYYINDLYTIRDGRVVKIFGMWDLLRAYLTEEGHILVEGYGGSFDTEQFFTEYEYNDGNLVFLREVRVVSGVYDGNLNEGSQYIMFNSLEEKQIMNNWYYGCRIVNNKEYFSGYTGLGVDSFVITDTQFAEFINENPPIELEVTSFEEYFG